MKISSTPSLEWEWKESIKERQDFYFFPPPSLSFSFFKTKKKNRFKFVLKCEMPL